VPRFLTLGPVLAVRGKPTSLTVRALDLPRPRSSGVYMQDVVLLPSTVPIESAFIACSLAAFPAIDIAGLGGSSAEAVVDIGCESTVLRTGHENSGHRHHSSHAQRVKTEELDVC